MSYYESEVNRQMHYFVHLRQPILQSRQWMFKKTILDKLILEKLQLQLAKW